MPRIEGTFLRSRVGRRIFLMFCIAVVLPAAIVFWLTYRTAAGNALEAARTAMSEENKHYALSVFERLQAARAMLDGIDPDQWVTGTVREPLLDHFFGEVALLELPPRAAPHNSALAARVAAHPAALSGVGLIALPMEPGAPPQIVLLARTRSDQGERLLAGRLHHDYLWGDPGEQSISGRICARSATQQLHCFGEAMPARPAGVMHHEWALFLKAHFNAPSWTFVADRQPEPLLASHLRFLAPLAVGLLALALLLSSIEIRRILVPLETLLGKIKAVGGGPQTDAEFAGKDEFATLTQTFGRMERRIGRQVETLQTLADIDRLILERVPLAAVIDTVLARIERIVAVRATGVLLKQADGATRSFVRVSGADTLESTGALLPETLRATPQAAAHDSAPADRRWQPLRPPGPALEAFGVRAAWVLALGHRDQAQGWIVLGRTDDQVPGDAQLAAVRELAERIAVALTVQAHENLLVFQARNDPLTGLGNRLAAGEALALAVQRAFASASAFATVFIDLDRFKSINDGMGHGLGDQVLVQAAERIRRSVGANDFVARFGGDEFFVILRDAGTTARAARATARIVRAFADPIAVDRVELAVRFSAGVALYPQHGADAEQLIHNSDVAMYRAKKFGGGRIQFFEDEMNAAALSRVQLENELRVAIRSGQLRVHYQPRVDSRSGAIVAVEALARWRHPDKGELPPTVFIALAEECGLIQELGAFVLDAACAQTAAWTQRGLTAPLMAVNVSSHQLRSGDFAQTVAGAMAAHRMAGSQLELEVTESLLVNDSGSAALQLQALRDAGARVAIDDFGTGYSSLAYLTRLPIDTLKIDREFIASLDGSEATLTVIRSIVALATALGKHTVAEGVESWEHVRLLSALGCHIVQGFVYYRPLDAEAMTEELIRLQRQRSAAEST